MSLNCNTLCQVSWTIDLKDEFQLYNHNLESVLDIDSINHSQIILYTLMKTPTKIP